MKINFQSSDAHSWFERPLGPTRSGSVRCIYSTIVIFFADLMITARDFTSYPYPTPTRHSSPLFPIFAAMFRIAIFASGAGSNARKIIEYFCDHPSISVSLVVCNKPGAGVIDIAGEEGIPVMMIEKERFFRGDAYVEELKQKSINFIVLAGFLWKLPPALVHAFPRKIINIHPALLPKYGGKGMYGGRVHEAVLAAKEKESGISIHYVDEIFDNGEVIFQVSCPIEPTDTPETLAARIHELEHANYPRIIEEVINLPIHG